MQKGIDMTEVWELQYYLHKSRQGSKYIWTPTLGKCLKSYRYDNVLYEVAVADWYFNGLCYLICLFFDYGEC